MITKAITRIVRELVVEFDEERKLARVEILDNKVCTASRVARDVTELRTIFDDFRSSISFGKVYEDYSAECLKRVIGGKS